MKRIILYGKKVRSISVSNFKEITINDFYTRSRKNIDMLSFLYGIHWYRFIKYSYPGHPKLFNYLAYGRFDDEPVTYHMYKPSDIGDVFFRFRNGKRLQCSTALDPFGPLGSTKQSSLKLWIDIVQKKAIDFDSDLGEPKGRLISFLIQAINSGKLQPTYLNELKQAFRRYNS